MLFVKCIEVNLRRNREVSKRREKRDRQLGRTGTRRRVHIIHHRKQKVSKGRKRHKKNTL